MDTARTTLIGLQLGVTGLPAELPFDSCDGLHWRMSNPTDTHTSYRQLLRHEQVYRAGNAGNNLLAVHLSPRLKVRSAPRLTCGTKLPGTGDSIEPNLLAVHLGPRLKVRSAPSELRAAALITQPICIEDENAAWGMTPPFFSEIFFMSVTSCFQFQVLLK
jgi:hypothetical protein